MPKCLYLSASSGIDVSSSCGKKRQRQLDWTGIRNDCHSFYKSIQHTSLATTTSSCPPIFASLENLMERTDENYTNGSVSSGGKGNHKVLSSLNTTEHTRSTILNALLRHNDALASEGAFYTVNIRHLYHQLYLWWDAFSTTSSIKPFYAVKCNPDPVIIRALVLLGRELSSNKQSSISLIGFDCASEREMELCLACGCTPQDIIFANPIKSANCLRKACKEGILTMTFDNVSELTKISQYFLPTQQQQKQINKCKGENHDNRQHTVGTNASENVPLKGSLKGSSDLPELILRIRVDDESSTLPLGEKFGALASTEISSLYEHAKSLGLEHCIRGVSFHVGSGCNSPGAFSAAICAARSVLCTLQQQQQQQQQSAAASGNDEASREYLIDIGGGFPGNLSSLGGTLSTSIQIPEVKKSIQPFRRIANAINEVFVPPRSVGYEDSLSIHERGIDTQKDKQERDEKDLQRVDSTSYSHTTNSAKSNSTCGTSASKCKGKSALENVICIAEPGTYFVEGSHTLYATIYASEPIKDKSRTVDGSLLSNVANKGDEDKPIEQICYIGEGVNGAFRDNIVIPGNALGLQPSVLSVATKKTTSLHEGDDLNNICEEKKSMSEDKSIVESEVRGPSGKKYDIVLPRWPLPRDPLEGEIWLAFPSMGAYTRALTANDEALPIVYLF
eukprot:g266.t1